MTGNGSEHIWLKKSDKIISEAIGAKHGSSVAGVAVPSEVLHWWFVRRVCGEQSQLGNLSMVYCASWRIS